MLTITQQVDPLRCDYLTVKNIVVASQIRIHHYFILRYMELKSLWFRDPSSSFGQDACGFRKRVETLK